MPTTVAILGFGRIGHVHAEALQRLDGVELVAATDELAEAIRAGADAVVIATPTWTHAAVARDLREAWDGRIIVEKPLATTVADVEAMLGDPRIDAVYHAAFAPEVEWAATLLPDWRRDHGALASTSMAFADAYAADLDRATATLGDSWLDGGINALSVLARLDPPARCTARRQVDGPCSTFVSTIECEEANAEILTTWAAVEASKSSRLTFADGAVLVLDHQAVLGRLEVDGRVVDHFATRSRAPRLVQHYVGCFSRLLVEGRRSFPPDVDRLLHRLSLDPPEPATARRSRTRRAAGEPLG